MNGRLLGLLFLAACAPKHPAGQPPPTTFEGRPVDLRVHLQGQPDTPVLVIPERGLLLHDRQGERRELRLAPLAGEGPVLAAGQVLGKVDWSTRNRWRPRYHAPSHSLLYLGDEANDEKLDLWRLPLDGGEPERLTDEPYLYGFAVSPDQQQVAIVVRRGEPPFSSCLELLRPDGSDRQQVLCDTPQVRFTWTTPAWAPDGRGLVLRVNRDGQRDRANLAWISLQQPELVLLTDPALPRSAAFAAERWVDAHRFAFAVAEGEHTRVGVYDLRTAEILPLTDTPYDLADLRVMSPADQPVALATLRRAEGDRLQALDPHSGALLDEHAPGGTLRFLGDDGASRAWVQVDGVELPLAMARLELRSSGEGEPVELEAEQLPLLDPEIERALVHCRSEQVRFPTHDLDPATGEPRVLHGWLHTPLNPPPPERALVRVLAFYGGGSNFSRETQAFCEAGIATFSPGVRGTGGRGPAFRALNDGDLGGDEIVDLFHAAHHLESLGYLRGRIGVFGRSHGGYATLRALTFPPGDHEVYPFAFGIAEAAFADILSFHATTNIPDWVLLEAGDPATEADRLLDRSPLTHVQRLAAPVLLVHGANDSRVPVDESRRFAEACAEAGGRCTYLELPGHGHAIRGLDDQVLVLQAKLAFLESVLDAAPADQDGRASP